MFSTVNILTSIISGFLSGYLVSLYFKKRDQTRLIIEYANQVADRAYEITMEALRYLESGNPLLLQRLLDRSLHLNYEIKIDEPLMNAITKCNQGIHGINQIIQEEPENIKSALLDAVGKMTYLQLDIWDAISKYKVIQRKTQQRVDRTIVISVGILLITFIAVMIFECRWLIATGILG